MKVLRLIETFYPNVTGPVNQAYAISHSLDYQGSTAFGLAYQNANVELANYLLSKGADPRFGPSEYERSVLAARAGLSVASVEDVYRFGGCEGLRLG